MEQQHSVLHRNLKNRHIQLIALGGAIGTGLFLGSASVIKSAGPSVILGYAIAGFIAFLIMRQLGEMIVEEPMIGGFSHFAYKYWSNFAGFVSGWNYWILYILVAMVELTAIGKYVQFWLPGFPTWLSITIFFILINLLNLTNVRIFGELEFWFSIIKVLAVTSMILFGSWILLSGKGGPQASITNLWSHGGFMPHGITGLLMVTALIMFSFGGLELIGITAAEATNPEQSIPKATNQVLWRIMIFYIGSLTILLSLCPWTHITKDISPFVLIFHELGEYFTANILNIVILTAAISVCNSCVYCNSRMLLGLAQQGNAPKFLLKVNHRGVPTINIFISAIATIMCIMVNFFMRGEAFSLLLAMVVSTLVINWAMISIVHIKFCNQKKQQGITTKFKALFYPVGNWLCLLFMVTVLIVMVLTPSMVISVWLIPIWLMILFISFSIKTRYNKTIYTTA